MNTQTPVPACENLVHSYDRLEHDFQRAIEKRLMRRGEQYMVPRILEIHDISHLETILEALLEGQNVASLC